jgi:deoxyribose-phosphate aldolase
VSTLSPSEIARRIDHTLLAASATPKAIEGLCDEALTHGFFAVCVNGAHVARCATRLAGTATRVASVVGFPLGAQAARVKLREEECALEDGAVEIDFVLQIGALLAGEERVVVEELKPVVQLAHGAKALVKVILETGLLTSNQITRACHLAAEAGADFVKTSTGFGPRGASLDDLRLMHAAVGGRLGLKASGGIRTHEFALELLAAGATRLGTSASVAILRPVPPHARSSNP